MSRFAGTPARRTLGTTLAGSLAASLLNVVVLSGVAGAQSGPPSVPLPDTPTVPVTQQSMSGRASDETTLRALHGDQPPAGAPLPGGGSYAATSLTPSATWQVSEQSGDFSWSYPVRVPPAAGGLQPNLALSYSSSAVDGLTSAGNAQPSWLGDGWSLWPGFVERSYGSCVDDLPGGGTEPADLCWRSDNATASFGGNQSELIGSGDGSGWRSRNDDGSRIERLTGAANGDENGEHWKITTVDGTQYFFGSRPESKSTWTVPVFGDDALEPCTTGVFATSSCTQAYRWNLDKVVDRNGNMLLYQYETETNLYGKNMSSAGASYVRNGWLDRIEYGLRSDQTLTPSGRVRFEVADRCVPGSTCITTKPENWPDVPWDSKCDSGTCPDKWSPTFWTTKRLSRIVAEVWDGTAHVPVDSWTLRHEFPDPGDGEKPALWLKGVTHTGHIGGTPVSLPEVTFEGVRKANRVYNPGTGDGHAALIRFRMNAIVSETGGVLSIQYAEPNCVHGSGMPANPESNTLRCFPVRWAAPNSPERTDYFHKYVVESVSQLDRYGSSVPAVTSYEYLDGAAWHYDESEITPDERKSWSGYRGYGRVRVRTGSGYDGPRTQIERRFYRGMHGDRLPSGTRSVTVSDSEGGVRNDELWLAGSGYESITYDGVTGPALAKSITDPVWQGPTATRGSRTAYIVRTGVQRTYALLEGGSWRTTRTETTYDDRGLPTEINDLADTGLATDDRCTTITYLRNNAAWLLSFPSRRETVAVHCEQTPTFPQDAIADVRTSYDLQSHTASPTRGNPTKVEVLETRPASGPVYTTVGTALYDVHGRVTESADALIRTNRTAYTPAVGGPTTQIVTTNPLQHVTTTDLDRSTGQVIKVVDPNNRRTEVAYDALGRTTEVWLPGRTRPTYGGHYKYSYQVRNDAPTVVTTSRLGPTENYTNSNAIFDGLLRPRQTQQVAVGGGRLLTDTRYDSHGRANKSTQPYFNNAAVDTNLWLPSDVDVPAMTVTEFDGAGRPTGQIFRGGGLEKWRSTATYGGDRVHILPPAGGTTTTAITDARGQTVELRQYTTPTVSDQFAATTYGYTAAGQLASVRDAAANSWSYEYDLRGRKITSTDPDKGTSTFGYDVAAQLTTTTDSRNTILEYAYDLLGRGTTTHLVPSTGPKVKLTERTYDTAIGGKGQLASATRWVDGNAYVRRVPGYTGLYQPLRTETVIPAVEGSLAGTYLSQYGYKPDGTRGSEYYAPTPDLVGETVMHVLDDFARVSETSGGFGTTKYASATDYTRYGELARVTLGVSPKRTWLSIYYDDHSRRLNRTIVDAETASPMLADYNHTYDDAGNLTKLADTPIGQPADNQCFRHDQLRRLTEAWTPSSGDCTVSPSVAGLGGPAPYWHSYSHDLVGNRQSETQHAASGDVTRTYAYPAAGAAQPHALDSVTTAQPGQPATVDAFDYDPAGNTTSRALAGRPQQVLTWDPEGHPTKVTENGQTTAEFVYDADGNRLLRKDATSVTAYLEGQEIRLDKASGVRTTTRYYTHAGQVVAMRQGTTVTYLASDHQGTNQIAVNAGTMAVSRRRQLPFGGPRGGVPPVWPDQKGFVGGTIDAATGLTHIGARDYDPAVGRFISVDPIMDLADPQQMHGYAYANNNPVTWSDPTGLIIHSSCPDGVCAPGQGTGAHQNAGAANPIYQSAPTGPVTVSHGPGIQTTHVPGTKTRYVNEVRVHPSLPSFDVLIPAMRNRAGTFGYVGEDQLFDKPEIIQLLEMACEDLAGDGLCDQKAFLRAYFVDQFVEIGLGRDGGPGNIGWRRPSINGPRMDASAVTARVHNDICRNSFTPDTLVLMADGTRKPIKDVAPGELVLATDPTTGRTQPRRVLAAIAGSGTKQLVDITVDIDGRAGDKTATITATDRHPFWVTDQRRWIDADHLQPGDTVLSTYDTPVEVLRLHRRSAAQTVHNLTIDGVHTYYVVAAIAPVLVHNCTGPARLSAETLDTHVLPRHGAGTPAKGTKFHESIDPDEFESLANTAVSRSPIPSMHDRTNGTHAHDYDFGSGRVIGQDGSTRLRVWVDDYGNVTTMHPLP